MNYPPGHTSHCPVRHRQYQHSSCSQDGGNGGDIAMIGGEAKGKSLFDNGGNLHLGGGIAAH